MTKAGEHQQALPAPLLEGLPDVMVQYAAGLSAQSASLPSLGRFTPAERMAEASSCSFGHDPYIELLAASTSLMRSFLAELASYASRQDDSAQQTDGHARNAANILCRLLEDRRLASSLVSFQSDAESAVTSVLESLAGRSATAGTEASAAAASQRLDALYRTFYGLPIPG